MTSMKRFLLWSFERGSIQYDIICLVILVFIFLTPPAVFNDWPVVRETTGDNGHRVFRVQETTEQAAVSRLKKTLGSVTVSKAEPVYDPSGALVAYSIWIER